MRGVSTKGSRAAVGRAGATAGRAGAPAGCADAGAAAFTPAGATPAATANTAVAASTRPAPPLACDAATDAPECGRHLHAGGVGAPPRVHRARHTDVAHRPRRE